jgi:two-component system cell cycle sensor histidine kinase/response regulator CckA
VQVASGPADPGPGEPAQAREGTVVLLVEDDLQVRTMAARALAEAGYVVLQAENGRAALDLARKRTERLDLVVADLGLPQMGGVELSRRLREQRPELPVVFISGYAGREAEHGSEGEPEPFLAKPFAPDVLVRKVAEVLAGRV